MMTFEEIDTKVYENSLNTCRYISGYINKKSKILCKCIIHNLEFESQYENFARADRKHHVCPECKANDLVNRNNFGSTEVECAYCKKKFRKANSKLANSKSGLYFCCREHKDLAQRLSSGSDFEAIRPEHYGKNITKSYRLTAFNNYPHKCLVCGWDEDEDVLEVHHIDENRDNNALENLCILCPICHKKLTTHKYKLEGNKIIKINVE